MYLNTNSQKNNGSTTWTSSTGLSQSEELVWAKKILDCEQKHHPKGYQFNHNLVPIAKRILAM